jgi:hypothetical protein
LTVRFYVLHREALIVDHITGSAMAMPREAFGGLIQGWLGISDACKNSASNHELPK